MRIVTTPVPARESFARRNQCMRTKSWDFEARPSEGESGTIYNYSVVAVSYADGTKAVRLDGNYLYGPPEVARAIAKLLLEAADAAETMGVPDLRFEDDK